MVNNQAILLYSVRNDFTGLATAALIAWKLTVITAINKAIRAAKTNTHQAISILYAKSCSHLLIPHQANGIAIMFAIKTNFKKLPDKSIAIFCTLAPITFRIPIS